MTAIETAAQVNRIGFPEFTSKLVKDTFDTLVASQIDQIEAYAELVKETAKTLSEYINDTQDDIVGEALFSFIQNVLPDLPANAIQAGVNNTPLSNEQATSLDNAITIEADNGSGGQIQPSGTITQTSSSDEILLAVARRISANKYEILLEVVQTGLIRLVVTDGVIESKLNFRTEEFNQSRQNSSSYYRSSFGGGARLGLFGRVFGLSASARYSRLSISTRSSSNTSTSSTDINIQGLVRINFKSDYQALSAPV